MGLDINGEGMFQNGGDWGNSVICCCFIKTKILLLLIYLSDC